MPDYNVQDYAPAYGGKIDSEGNVKNIADAITPAGKVAVDIGEVGVTINASDIQIGAVEIKDATGANRLAVNSDGSINIRVIGSIDGGTF